MTTIFIPWTKVTREKGEDIFWVKQEGIINLESALANHLKINNPPPDVHLFTYKYWKSHHPMACNIFLKRINKIINKKGLNTWPNHNPGLLMLNWNDLQRSVWNGSQLLSVTGDRINRYRANKRRTDRPDSDHHMIDWSTPVLHLWPNKNKHGLCALNYYYIYRVLSTV